MTAAIRGGCVRQSGANCSRRRPPTDGASVIYSGTAPTADWARPRFTVWEWGVYLRTRGGLRLRLVNVLFRIKRRPCDFDFQQGAHVGRRKSLKLYTEFRIGFVVC